MDSRTAAHVLSEIADLLSFRAENRFKSRAYRNAAKAVLALNTDDLLPAYRSGELGRLRGIGKSTLGVIGELIETGESSYLDQLRQNVPEGVVELMQVPGLNSEKIQLIHEALGVSTVEQLEAAARDGRLTTIKGFGEKTAASILDAIAFMRNASTLDLFPRAAAEAVRLCEAVRRHPDVTAAEIGGSVRRVQEVVRNVDIVAAVRDHPEEVAASFTRIPGVIDATTNGPDATVRFVDRTLLDLRCVRQDQLAVAWWRATGSQAHVDQMTEALANRGYSVRGDEIFDRSGTRVPIATESDLYALVDLRFIPPEMREGSGELAAARGPLPVLVRNADIRGVLHCHSNYSDGHTTIAELVEAARGRGWSYVGITDHSMSASYAGGLSPADVVRQHEEIDALNATLTDFRVLKGIEADILVSGDLDYPDDILDRFDYVIASVHSRFRMGESEMTARILKALDDPRLTILGHPTGRLLLSRDPYPVDIEAVLEKAAEGGIAIELNADPKRLDLDWRHLRRARELGIPVEIGPDAHSIRGLDCVELGVGIARKAWLEAGDILNARSADDVLAFATARRERAYERWSAPRAEAAPQSSDDDIPF
jgi:DNA polymerase (family 10)